MNIEIKKMIESAVNNDPQANNSTIANTVFILCNGTFSLGTLKNYVGKVRKLSNDSVTNEPVSFVTGSITDVLVGNKKFFFKIEASLTKNAIRLILESPNQTNLEYFEILRFAAQEQVNNITTQQECENAVIAALGFLNKTIEPNSKLSTEVFIFPENFFIEHSSTDYHTKIVQDGNPNDTILIYSCNDEIDLTYKGLRSKLQLGNVPATTSSIRSNINNRWSDALYSGITEALLIGNLYTSICICAYSDDTSSKIDATILQSYIRTCQDLIHWNISAVLLGGTSAIFKRIGIDSSNITKNFVNYMVSRHHFNNAAKHNLPVVNYTYNRYED